VTKKIQCDVLVVGSGAAGLAAATAAALHGLKVVIAEKDKYVGGTTALSGGFMWIPCAPASIEAGVKDSIEDARVYLRDQAGNFFDAERVEAFLQNGPEATTFFESKTALHFEAAPEFSDYHPEAPGGRAGGRSILAKSYDARKLGKELNRLRPPIRELTLFGMIIGTGPDLKHFMNATRSLYSTCYVAMRLATHLGQLLRYGRGMRLTNGGALAGRLFQSALEAGVEVWTDAPVRQLLREGKVVGAQVETRDGLVEVGACRGVVLAAGGFPQDKARRARLFPHDKDGNGHFSPAPIGNTGDGLRLGEAIGGVVDESYPNAAAWVPLSRVPRKDGSKGVFPHFIDRGKPGLIAVTPDGKRFTNEANSYHDFVQGLFAAQGPEKPARAFLLVDHKFIRQYGLGYVKPFPLPLGPHLRSGYLKRGRTIEELASQIGVPAAALKTTVAEYNDDARRGVDTKFGKGSTAYNRYYGDATFKPNPCLAPIQNAPFYAVEIVVGDLGTFAGLKTNKNAQVLGKDGQPIPGLYACGNDPASIMGGNYPGGGITLGPGITFAYIAARHLAGTTP
jgi:succinate dehydrogenase/fumarate reductase flavoprotein subunit